MSTPRELLSRHGLRPKKDWGQNFLGRPAHPDRIAQSSIGAGGTVVELGAGLGHLTRALAETGASVVAVGARAIRRPFFFLLLFSLGSVVLLRCSCCMMDCARALAFHRALGASSPPMWM